MEAVKSLGSLLGLRMEKYIQSMHFDFENF